MNKLGTFFQIMLFIFIGILGLSIGRYIAIIANGEGTGYTHILLIATWLVVFFDITLILDLEEFK